VLLSNSSKKPIRIDNYKVLKQLGKGGFGTVYHVCDTSDESKEYALKLLHKAYNVARLKSQLSVLEILNKSELFFTVYRAKKMGGQFYLLMDYTSDLSVKKLVKKEVFSESLAKKVLYDVLESLEYLQKNKIIHGDIKAENIMRKNNRYYIIDFDIAKISSPMKTIHIENDDDFVAPEIFQGTYDYASDIYSLGCTLYYMLSAKHIYNFQSSHEFSKKMFSHLYMQAKENTCISNKMMYLIGRMTDKNYKTRATIVEVREILEDFKMYEQVGLKDKKNIDDFNSEYALYHVMADEGISYAQNVLGLMYEEGIGIKVDIDKAFVYYKFAAEQGLAKAQFNLALCYKMAKGCEKDYIKAREFFTYASKQNHNRSFYELGLMYEDGLALKKDEKKANELYQQSAMNGFKPAYKKLEIINKM
jgi:uncharacterized protein